MEDESQYYALLKDPTRRKILEILGAQEKIGFKELREALGLGTGTVYYHLDMLSAFLDQDKQRKYRLNDRGRSLHAVLKEGNVPPALAIGQTASHGLGKWVFLSPVFAKTAKPAVFLPVSLLVLLVGALGTALGKLDPALFFYFQYSSYGFTSLVTLYVSNWIGLFLFVELLAYALYRRVGNDLQLFTSLSFATFPIAAFPYIYLATPDTVSQYVLIALQVWSLLLVSSALCFGKGIRLDKAFILSLTAIYVNIAVLFVLGRFT